jgi:hypothetical protein
MPLPPLPGEKRFRGFGRFGFEINVTVEVLDTSTGLTTTYSNALANPFTLIRDGPFVCQ